MSELHRDAELENLVGQELITDAQLQKIRDYLISKLEFRGPIRVSKKFITYGGKKYRITVQFEEVKPDSELPPGIPEPHVEAEEQPRKTTETVQTTSS